MLDFIIVYSGHVKLYITALSVCLSVVVWKGGFCMFFCMCACLHTSLISASSTDAELISRLTLAICIDWPHVCSIASCCTLCVCVSVFQRLFKIRWMEAVEGRLCRILCTIFPVIFYYMFESCMCIGII